MPKEISSKFIICFKFPFPSYNRLDNNFQLHQKVVSESPLLPFLFSEWYFDLIKILLHCIIKEIMVITCQQPTGNHHLDVRKETGNTA